MAKRYTSTGIEIPEGYVEVDPADDFEHDPLAGTVDPETGLTYATDEDVKQAINEVAQAMLDATFSGYEQFQRELAACTTEEERAKLYEKYGYPADDDEYFMLDDSENYLFDPDYDPDEIIEED